MTDASIRWTSASTYAVANQLTRQRVIAQILDGHLNGVVSDLDWYVLDFEVEEDKRPDPDGPDRRLALDRREVKVH